MPIADVTQRVSSVQFPGDAVEVARLPPGRVTVGKVASVTGVGVAAAKFVGVADGVPVGGVLMAEKEVVGSVAHDNSNGGVAVICKHEDKVVVWSVKMIVFFKILMMLMMMMITIIIITITMIRVVCSCSFLCYLVVRVAPSVALRIVLKKALVELLALTAACRCTV
jgi:hypothetical protein